MKGGNKQIGALVQFKKRGMTFICSVFDRNEVKSILNIRTFSVKPEDIGVVIEFRKADPNLTPFEKDGCVVFWLNAREYGEHWLGDLKVIST